MLDAPSLFLLGAKHVCLWSKRKTLCLLVAGAMVAGPRLGRFDRDGKPRPMPGHNSVFYIAGVLLLW